MVCIRKAHSGDLPALVKLWKECMDFHKESDPFFTRSTEGHVRWATFVRSNMDDAEWIVLVAECEDDIVGYCMANILACPPVLTTVNHGFVQDMAVTEPFQRMGIGTRLFDRVEQWFLDRGILRIELNVAKTNPKSRAFWREMGFGDFVERLTKTY